MTLVSSLLTGKPLANTMLYFINVANLIVNKTNGSFPNGVKFLKQFY